MELFQNGINSPRVRQALVWALAETGAPNIYQWEEQAKVLGFRFLPDVRNILGRDTVRWHVASAVLMADIFRAMGVCLEDGELMPRRWFLDMIMEDYEEAIASPQSQQSELSFEMLTRVVQKLPASDRLVLFSVLNRTLSVSKNAA